ncbi:MAG: hypothetical protein QXR53_00560 [Candidatus Norongarragalinales archaeon]
MRLNAFASVEAVLALVFAAGAFVVILPSFHPALSFTVLHRQQFAQDFAEISLSKPEFFQAVLGLREGREVSKRFLKAEYSKILEGLGDFCVELSAGGNAVQANCGFEITSKARVSRMVFDGRDFFELAVSVGSRD